LWGFFECYQLFKSLFWDKHLKLIEAPEDMLLRLEDEANVREVEAKRLLESIVNIKALI